MNYAGRIAALQLEMKERHIDLAVYGGCPVFQYLTGLGPLWREARDMAPSADILFVPRDGDPVLTRARETAERSTWIRDARTLGAGESLDGLVHAVVHDIAPAARTVGLGRYLPGSALIALVRAAGNPDLVDASRLVDRARMIKEPDEIELLGNAARLTDRVMETVIADIRAGVTQQELNLAIEMQARRLGASHVSFEPTAGFVKSGFAASDPMYAYPPGRGLEPHTEIFFDVGFVLDGYCSDWGRSVYWGTPPRHAVEGHKALRQAMLDTVGAVRPGRTRACDVYPAMEAILDKLGYGDRLRARLAPSNVMGHQIGVEVHENPWLRPGNEEPLVAGMVMCLEPKLWHPGEYYFRLEDMILVGKDGAEFLTNFDRELFSL